MAYKTVTRCILFVYRLILINPLSDYDDNSNNNKNNDYFNKSRLIGTVYSVFGSVYLTVASGAIVALITRNKHDFVEFVLPIGYASTIFMNGINHLIIAYNVPNISRLLRSIESDVYRYKDEPCFEFNIDNDDDDNNNRKIYSDRFVKKFSLYLTTLIYNNAFLGMISPFFGYLLTGRLSANIYPSWFPWNTSENRLGYIVSYVLESYVALHVCSLYACTAVYTALVYLEYKRQYERMTSAVRTIPSRCSEFVERSLKTARLNSSSTRGKNDFERYYDKRFERNLIDCIEHHKTLNELYFEMNFSLEFTLCVLTLCFLMYSLLEVTDAGRIFSILAVMTILLQNLFLKCYVGEKFSELNDTLKEAIYDLPWYRQSISNRKLIQIFQLASTRPYRLNGLKVFPASLFIFSRIIKTSYSLLNLLRASNYS